jgi:hypothetical protein
MCLCFVGPIHKEVLRGIDTEALGGVEMCLWLVGHMYRSASQRFRNSGGLGRRI